jgi:rod shape-determining protein MreC
VIGTSGSEQSRVLYIDKGANDGIKADMAVITPTGIVGKIVQAFPSSSQVLPINDQLSGVGAALKALRLQGILKGAANGTTTLQYIMSDEPVKLGEEVITSGGDRIFPKGLPIGTVASVEPGKDLFLNIRVIPSARLDRLEEVLVVTKIQEKLPDTTDLGPIRASDILSERLPGVPVTQPVDAAGNAAGTASGTGNPAQLNAPAGITPAKPGATTSNPANPAANAAKPGTVAVPNAAKPVPAAKPSNKPQPTTPANTGENPR